MTEQSIYCSPELIALVTSRYGAPMIAVLPQVRPDADHAEAFERLLADVTGAPVVLFPDIRLDSLDGFFHLRLVQVLRMQSPLPALSIIAIRPGRDSSRLAGGFSDRFRSSWPFAHCIFITDCGNPGSLTAELGLPVCHAFDAAAVPSMLRSRARSEQQIAMQFQPIWRRCGSTTGFENQIQGLVRGGFLTIRLFMDGKLRRGPTLNAALQQVIPENGTHAGAHISLVSVPYGPPIWADPGVGDVAQLATWLAQESSCIIHDTAAMQAAKRAHSVIATHLERLGPALVLAPQARLLLDVRDDRVLAERARALTQGATEAQADVAAASMARAQEQVLGIADICTFVSVTEAERLGPQCQCSITVPPRIYATPPSLPKQPLFDLLLTGDLHVFNIASLRWFLDDVWLPYLAEASVSVAIVGRVGDRIGAATYTSPLLHFMGFVEDLEAVRSQCRLTVVPDRAGTGVSVKLLNALAVEHPVATTTTGLRGLESSVASQIPAHDEAAALAADILNVIGSAQHLEERRTLVRAAQQAIHRAADYADLLMSIESPTASVRQVRATKWARIIAAAAPLDPRPYYFGSDATFVMSGCAWDHQVLLDGWHDAEPWGRWTDGVAASLRLTVTELATEPLRLELDIIPSPIGASLSIAIEDLQFPAIDPVQGTNAWDIPLPTTQGKRSFLLTLRVTGTVCPARASGSADERVLGIGVSAVRLRTRQPTLCQVGTRLPINAGSMPREVLLHGWHPLEDWGCWSNSRAASLKLTFARPLAGTLTLEIDLATPPAGTTLTVIVNEARLPPIVPCIGSNTWLLPETVTDGQSEIRIELHTSSTFCPAELNGSADDRILGIGIHSLGVYAFGTRL